MIPRRRAPVWALGLLSLAGCTVTEPLPEGPQLPIDPEMTIQNRSVERLDISLSNQQRFVFSQPVTLDLDLQESAKAPRTYTGVTIEGRAIIDPPQVDGRDVQITDVLTHQGGKWAVATANVAGEEIRGAIQIFDLKDPYEPELASEILTPNAEYASGVIVGKTLYAFGVDANTALVDVFDLHKAENPRHVRRLELEAHIAITADHHDDMLYVVTGADGGLHVLDTSDPENPIEVRFVDIPDARDVAVHGDEVLVLTGAGLAFVQPDDSYDVVAVGALPPEAPTRGVHIANSYIVNTLSGLVMVTLSDRTVQVMYTGAEGTSNGLATDDDNLFFRANGESGLEVVHRDHSRDYDLVGTLDLANAGSSNSAAARHNQLLSGDGRGGVLLCSYNYDLYDNFEGRLLRPYPWIQASGDWRVERLENDRRFTASGPGERSAFWGVEADWSDVQLDARVYMDDGAASGLYFRAQDVEGDCDAYVFQIEPGLNGGSFSFRRVHGGELSQPLASVAQSDVAELADSPWFGVWRDLRVAAHGPRLRAWVDGVRVLDATDARFKSGSVGLRTWGATQTWFDDINVRDLSTSSD